MSLSIGTSEELAQHTLQLPDLTPTHRYSSVDFSPKRKGAADPLWALAAAKREQQQGGHRFSKWQRRQGAGLKPLFGLASNEGMGAVREEEGEA